VYQIFRQNLCKSKELIAFLRSLLNTFELSNIFSGSSLISLYTRVRISREILDQIFFLNSAYTRVMKYGKIFIIFSIISRDNWNNPRTYCFFSNLGHFLQNIFSNRLYSDRLRREYRRYLQLTST